MFHIGFDPLLETQQGHKALIRENELMRIAHECTSKTRAGFLSISRLLARLGKGLALLGINLESRFGETLEDRISLNNSSSSGSCLS